MQKSQSYRIFCTLKVQVDGTTASMPRAFSPLEDKFELDLSHLFWQVLYLGGSCLLSFYGFEPCISLPTWWPCLVEGWRLRRATSATSATCYDLGTHHDTPNPIRHPIQSHLDSKNRAMYMMQPSFWHLQKHRKHREIVKDSDCSWNTCFAWRWFCWMDLYQ